MPELKEVEEAFSHTNRVIMQLEQEIKTSVEFTQIPADYNIREWCNAVSESIAPKMTRMAHAQAIMQTLIAILIAEGHPCIWDEGDRIKCVRSDPSLNLKKNKIFTVEYTLEENDAVNLVKVKEFEEPVPVSYFVLVSVGV